MKIVKKKRKIATSSYKQNLGITIVALVITIIVLLIISGVSIIMLGGKDSLIDRAKDAKEESNLGSAKDIINLKISNIQIGSYLETQKLPNLQYVSDKLCEDKEIEYVELGKKIASTKIDVKGYSSIYTKLKEYPYKFEINSSLQLASIDGENIIDNNQTIENRLAKLEQEVTNLKTENELLKRNTTNNIKLVTEYWKQPSENIKSLEWTRLKEFSFSEYGTGKAIINFTVQNQGASKQKCFQININVNGMLYAQDSDYCDGQEWVSCSAGVTINYDQNTTIGFDVYGDASTKPYYTYSILIIPDNK